MRALLASLLAVGLSLPLAAAGAESSDAQPKTKEEPVVVLETTLGNIEIQLEPEKAPITVKNFLAYVDAGFYDGTVFHRVIPGFMIQGGGFDASLHQKDTRAPIKNEASNGLTNERGTIAMARTSNPDSATAQFFINLKGNDFLNHGSRDQGYAVFGHVVGGMDVVDKIAGVPTGNRGMHQNVPTDPVVIEKATRK
jgi:peptidyl-prolyl cis-trans isomerase A (cyclophilin A)